MIIYLSDTRRVAREICGPPRTPLQCTLRCYGEICGRRCPRARLRKQTRTTNANALEHPTLIRRIASLPNMDRFRSLFTARPRYEPIEDRPEDGDIIDEEDIEEDSVQNVEETSDASGSDPFSKVYYSIFLLMGIAMLWAW
jgi:hypothetical protein